MERFQKYHRHDTSYKTKKIARRKAEETLKRCEGFMLFTVNRAPDGRLHYSGNAFIEADYAAGMPEFIREVLAERGMDVTSGKENDKIDVES